MVDTCDLMTDQISKIRTVFLAVDINNIIIFAAGKIICVDRADMEFFRHKFQRNFIQGTEIHDIRINVPCFKKVLKPESCRDGIRIREIMRLNDYFVVADNID